MHSEYQHLIDLSDYPVSWWKKVIELGDETFQKAEIDGMLSIYTKTKFSRICVFFAKSL